MSSTKRKDSKNRNLRMGEVQRKDGMYMYRYAGKDGKTHAVYGWKLVPTDTVPKGKHDDISLREKEDMIANDLARGIDTQAKAKATVNMYVKKYLELKKDQWKETTYSNNKYLWEKFIKRDFGTRRICNVTKLDIKEWYCAILDDGVMGIGTLNNLNAVLQCVFDLAVDDDIISKNPCIGSIAFIKQKYHFQKNKRHALTEEQQQAFVKYLNSEDYFETWKPIYITLLGTGCRVSEIIGLRWRDVDFKSKTISINHNLICRKDKGLSTEEKYYFTSPKTKAGIRVIPMLLTVEKALLQSKELQARLNPWEKPPVIEGCNDWVFLNYNGNLFRDQNLNRMLKVIASKYNESETVQAKLEQREPVLLPSFSVHNLRHTFATRFCENETNIKVIQAVLGHADIATTMDVYAEATTKKIKEVVCNLEDKICLE